MTSREKAIAVLRVAAEISCADYSNIVNAIEHAIDEAVREAVAAEREAIAVMLAEYAKKASDYHAAVANYYRVNRCIPGGRGPNALTLAAAKEVTDIADSIRARSTSGTTGTGK